MHGRRDRLIPFSQSELLQRQAPGNVHLFPVAEAKHNNLPDFAEYHEWLYDLLNEEVVFPAGKGEQIAV